jgi:hypothetical protein
MAPSFTAVELGVANAGGGGFLSAVVAPYVPNA